MTWTWIAERHLPLMITMLLGDCNIYLLLWTEAIYRIDSILSPNCVIGGIPKWYVYTTFLSSPLRP